MIFGKILARLPFAMFRNGEYLMRKDENHFLELDETFILKKLKKKS